MGRGAPSELGANEADLIFKLPLEPNFMMGG